MNPKLHHVGILAESLDSFRQGAGRFYYAFSNADPIFRRVEEFECDCYLYGQVELIIPYGGKLLEYLRSKPVSPIHHIAFLVNDSDYLYQSSWRENTQVKLIRDQPVRGVGGTLVNFIHPSCFGLLIELVYVLENLQ